MILNRVTPGLSPSNAFEIRQVHGKWFFGPRSWITPASRLYGEMLRGEIDAESLTSRLSQLYQRFLTG